MQRYFFAHPFEISDRFLRHLVGWSCLQHQPQDTLASATLIARDQLITHTARMYAVVEHYRRHGELNRLLELPGVLRLFNDR